MWGWAGGCLIATCMQLLSGRRGSPQRLRGADHKGVSLSRGPACRLISMETQTWHPSGLVSAVAPSSESTWGCGPAITWAPGDQEALLPRPFYNLPVCHLGSRSNKKKNQLGIGAETLFTGPLYLWRRFFVPVGLNYGDRRTSHNSNPPDIPKFPQPVLPSHVKTNVWDLRLHRVVSCVFWLVSQIKKNTWPWSCRGKVN